MELKSDSPIELRAKAAARFHAERTASGFKAPDNSKLRSFDESRERHQPLNEKVHAKLLEGAARAAEALSHNGLVGIEVARQAKTAVLEKETRNITRHLKTYEKRGDIKAILKEMDPMIRVWPVGELGGAVVRPREVPASVRLGENTRVNFLAPNDGEITFQGNRLVVGGQDIFRASAAKVAFEKNYGLDEASRVYVNVRSDKAGEPYCLVMSPGEYLKIRDALRNYVEPKEKIQVAIEIGAKSDVGKVRDHDEDSCIAMAKGKGSIARLANSSTIIRESRTDHIEAAKNQQQQAAKMAEKILQNGVDGLFLVADGMGGAEAGEWASEAGMMKAMEQVMMTNDWSVLSSDEVKAKIKHAATEANRVVYEQKVKLPPGKDLGSTLTMAMVIGDQLYVANVGDSRTYLYSKDNRALTQVTKDHSLVQSLVDAGQLTREEMADHPQSNLVFRVLGGKKDIDVDVFGPIKVDSKTRIMCCCDGLWEEVNDGQIASVLSQNLSSSETANQLVNMANNHGGKDNTTVIVADTTVTKS